MADDVPVIPPGRSLDHPAVFSRYNRWANTRLYDACAGLAPDAYMAERPSFFGSIHRTLNHILVGDLLWLGRLEGRPQTIALDAELHGDLASLRTITWARPGGTASLPMPTAGARPRKRRGSRSTGTSSTTRPITVARSTACFPTPA
jgi:hypothetical protein